MNMLPVANTKPTTNRPVVVPGDNYQFLNNLQAYNLNSGVDCMLDLSRAIWDSGDYFNQGVGIPDIPEGTLLNFAQNETKSGVVQVPGFSYLVAVSCFSQNTGGFKIRIFDKGTGAEMISTLFMQERALGSNQTAQDPNMFAATPETPQPTSPYLLTSPLIVTPVNPGTGGILQWEITNMDSNVNGNLIQVLLEFAVPRNAQNEQLIIAEQ